MIQWVHILLLDSMNRSPQWQPNIVPAQLSFLAIYNPSLGPTEETFRDQLLFYYSRTAAEAKTEQKKNGKTLRSGTVAGAGEPREQENEKEHENEKLRHIGLAQGVVDFAR